MRVRHHGQQSARQLPRLVDRFIYQPHNFGRIRGIGDFSLRQFLFVHLGHEGNSRQVLPQAVVQILSDPPLLPGADVQQRSLQLFAFRDINSGGNNVIRRAVAAGQQGTGPRNQSIRAVPRHPMALIILRKQIGAQLFDHGPGSSHLLRQHKEIPDAFAPDLVERVAGGQFAGPIEAHDAPVVVEDRNQRPNRIQYSGDEVPLLLESSLGVFQIGDIECHAMDEPWLAIGAAHHPRIAVKPDHVSIARDHAIRRSQRLARQKHLRRFQAPALLVVRMDVLDTSGPGLPATPRESSPMRLQSPD